MSEDAVIPQPNALQYRGGALYVEEIAATELVRRFGTPLYVYSEAVLREQYRRLQSSLDNLARNVLICFALKANANPSIGHIFAELGAGADVVSGGEIFLARHAGFDAGKIVFAGVGKTRREMSEALAMGVRSFHVESAGEMDALAQLAADVGTVAPVSVRVNPNIEAGTHPHITTGTRANKFGVSPAEALAVLRRAVDTPLLKPVGLHAHIGSQLPRVQPMLEATRVLLELWDRLASEGIVLRELDLGGGLGIPYLPNDKPEGPEELAAGLRPLLLGRDVDLVFEPGRFLVGPAGALLTTVLYMKELGDTGDESSGDEASRTLAVVDAGMNDLLRPALYDAYHPVWPEAAGAAGSGPIVDIVGPVCESSDVMAKRRRVGSLSPGDLLAIGQTGAYGYSMASQYNGRRRPAEVLVSGDQAHLIRARDEYTDLLPQ